MSFLRGSSNYVWCTTSVLGKGATGFVYQGVNRHTGEPVAVKTFNQLSHMRPIEVQMREFQVLQKVNHENIVKLLAIEEDQEGRGKVIVMELCTGGSLFNILDDPENSYGLEESEFILVLKHLAAGINHLRDNNLVHRDLKPGNIMKFIDVDGSTIYKLTDFGAARELQDDQQFMSLYGTEEYLHPDMYERAVLKKPVGKWFGARVDLWSIGVTLYHVATGQLPFRPYGGRKNQETMHLITTEKVPGVISGVQTSENGAIKWSTELPSTCQLSAGLCQLVTPLLGGLLEVDPHRMWNFEKFFKEVTKLLQRKVIHIFYVNRVRPIVVYMEETQKYEQLQYMICEQTDILPSQQLLLFGQNTLFETVGEDTVGKDFPITNPLSPIVLFSKVEDDVLLTLPDSPALAFSTFSNSVSVEHDAGVGKSICSVGMAMKRRVEYLCKCMELIEYSVKVFIDVTISHLKDLHSRIGHLHSLTSAISDQFSHMVNNHRRFLVITQMITYSTDQEPDSLHLSEKLEDLVNNKVEEEKEVRMSLSTITPVINQLYKRVVTNTELRRQWQPRIPDEISIKKSPNKASTYVAKLRESWIHLNRDKAARTLTHNDDQFHQLEKMKMKETAKSLERLLTASSSSLVQMSEHFADWCKVSKVIRVQTEIEESDVTKHSTLLLRFQARLKETEESYHHTLSEMLGIFKDQKFRDIQKNNKAQSPDLIPADIESQSIASHVSTKSQKEDPNKAKVKMTIRQLMIYEDEVLRLLAENSDIIQGIKDIASPTFERE